MKYNIIQDHTECLECGQELFGRADKKFCSNYCKNKYHNKEYSARRKIQGRVQRILASNYSLLETLIASGGKTFSLSDLEVMGFRPFFITGHGGGEKREECWCYDIVYNKTPTTIYNIRHAEKMMGGAK